MAELGGRDAATVSLERALSLLADPVRRHALAVVRDRETVTLRELSWAVTSRATGTVRLTDGRSALDRYRIRLHHVHLPKLAAAGLVTYDTDRRTVELAAEPSAVTHLLADVSDGTG